NELEVVADALFGVQHEALASGIGTVPRGPAVGALGEALALPAPLELRPAALEIAQLQPGHAAALVRLGVVRVEADGLLETRQGLGRLAAFRQGGAEVVVPGCLPRLQAHRLAEVLDALGGLALL